jgi:hypothetical protein
MSLEERQYLEENLGNRNRNRKMKGIRPILWIGLVLSTFWITACGTTESGGGGQVAPPANEGLFTFLAVDSLGQPHISFYDSTDGALKYTWFDIRNQVWNDQFVDLNPAGPVGMDTSLALDPPTGFPRISYYDQTHRQLLLAAWDGMRWILQVVDPGAGDDVGQFSSLALDSSGHPYIAYYDATQRSLKLVAAVNTVPPFSFSFPITVDTGNVGQDASLALDPVTQEYRIAYYDAQNQRNKAAIWDNATLTFKIYSVDPGTGTGLYNSLVVDPGTGSIQIAYYDFVGHRLRYARSTSPPFTISTPLAWTIETVDSGSGDDVGQFASLTLDGSANSRISYYDATLMTLKLAEWNGTGWQLSSPLYFGSGSPDTGSYNSIKINPQTGSLYVSYYNRTTGALGFNSFP